jgi:hypothetical protein
MIFQCVYKEVNVFWGYYNVCGKYINVHNCISMHCT